MAKAGGKTTTWILLSEAKARADSAFQDRKFAERRLTEWLVADKLRWRSEYLDGSKRDCDPGSGDPKFWVEPPLTFPPPGPVLIIQTRTLIKTWDESWVRRRWAWADSYTFRRIEVVEEDLAKLLPAGSTRARAKKDAMEPKDWLTAEVKRMKAEGEIPGGITKTEFATLLEEPHQGRCSSWRGDEAGRLSAYCKQSR